MSDLKIDTVQARSRILVSIDEAAALLSLSKSTLNNMLAEGTGPHPTRRGKRVLFRIRELERWADSEEN